MLCQRRLCECMPVNVCGTDSFSLTEKWRRGFCSFVNCLVLFCQNKIQVCLVDVGDEGARRSRWNGFKWKYARLAYVSTENWMPFSPIIDTLSWLVSLESFSKSQSTSQQWYQAANLTATFRKENSNFSISTILSTKPFKAHHMPFPRLLPLVHNIDKNIWQQFGRMRWIRQLCVEQ